MVKVCESLRCKICKRLFKNKRALTQHKKVCKPKNTPLKQCEFCQRFTNKKHYRSHFLTCHKRNFFKVFRLFLNFLYRLVVAYNKQNEFNKYARFVEVKKYLIYKKKIENVFDIEKLKKLENEFNNDKKYIKNNMNIYKEIIQEIKEKEENKINEIKKEINFDKSKTSENKLRQLNNLFQTIEYTEIPSISFRDIINNYIYSNDLKNIKIKKALDRIYGKKDFLTEEEIQKTDVYYKFKELCSNADAYWKNYNKFYDMLDTFTKDNNSYRCVFCRKFVLHKLIHLKKCKMLKEKIEKDDKETIYIKIIKYVFKEEQYEKINLKNILKKYLNKSLKYFLKNIYNNIIDVINFERIYREEEIKEINEEKKKEIRDLNEQRKLKNLKNISYTNFEIILLKTIVNLEVDFKIHINKENEKQIKKELLLFLCNNEEKNILLYLKNMKIFKKEEKEKEIEEEKEKEIEEEKEKETEEEKEKETEEEKEKEKEKKEEEEDILEKKSVNFDDKEEEQKEPNEKIREEAKKYFSKIFEIRKRKRNKRKPKFINKIKY
jgi:hypothetical protein